MKKNNNTFTRILKATQEELFKYLCRKYQDNAISETGFDSFLFVKGEAPIMLVAHLDTVHVEPVRDICYSNSGRIIMSPQGIGGDDRCGVYALNTIYDEAGKKPHLLFTCDEEFGGYGAQSFCNSYFNHLLPPEVRGLKLIIEIDRQGKNDAVYYDCKNRELEKYISNKGFKTEKGSFSDISYIAPALAVAAVNLSGGYYNQHTLHEYIDFDHLANVIWKVAAIVDEVDQLPYFGYYENTRRRPSWEYDGKGSARERKDDEDEFSADETYEMPTDDF